MFCNVLSPLLCRGGSGGLIGLAEAVSSLSSSAEFVAVRDGLLDDFWRRPNDAILRKDLIFDFIIALAPLLRAIRGGNSTLSDGKNCAVDFFRCARGRENEERGTKATLPAICFAFNHVRFATSIFFFL